MRCRKIINFSIHIRSTNNGFASGTGCIMTAKMYVHVRNTCGFGCNSEAIRPLSSNTAKWCTIFWIRVQSKGLLTSKDAKKNRHSTCIGLGLFSHHSVIVSQANIARTVARVIHLIYRYFFHHITELFLLEGILYFEKSNSILPIQNGSICVRTSARNVKWQALAALWIQIRPRNRLSRLTRSTRTSINFASWTQTEQLISNFEEILKVRMYRFRMSSQYDLQLYTEKITADHTNGATNM